MMAAYKKQAEWTLKHLLDGFVSSDMLPEKEVKGLTIDSRNASEGFVFVALEGQFDHGLAYAEAAINRGAIAVLCDATYDHYCQQILSKLVSRVVCIPVYNLAAKLPDIAKRFYGSPSEKLFVTGITGTDGKTSVSHFIAQALSDQSSSDSHSDAAIIGTLGNGSINDLGESTHTTPDVINVQKMMSEFVDKGIKSVAMEVSSHGLDQGRVSGVDFNVCLLTNLSRDHLDYHGSIESYKQAKKKLFSEHECEAVVVNYDDDFGKEIYREISDISTVWLYGLNEKVKAEGVNYVFAENIVNTGSGVRFLLKTSAGESEVSVGVIGQFNVYNLLACFCVLLQKGINFNRAIKRLEQLETVPGRMELIKKNNQSTVVIDFAHTPEALKQALVNVRKHTPGKVICVFGCGGDRDSGKRPLMAKAAETYADLVIVTDDNPRNESSENIIDEIKLGIENDLNLIIEPDRERAIKQAIELAAPEDLILVAGKGHETFQQVANQKIPFSDREIALKYLEGNA